jgi:hypothetical protein
MWIADCGILFQISNAAMWIADCGILFQISNAAMWIADCGILSQISKIRNPKSTFRNRKPDFFKNINPSLTHFFVLKNLFADEEVQILIKQ